MATLAAAEQLQPDDLSVRGGCRAASVSPPPVAGRSSGSEEESAELPSRQQQAAPPPPQQQTFSQLSRLLRPGLADPPATPFRCSHEQCAFETYSRAALDTHTRGHAGRRFHECDVCRMRFTNGANLRRHRMRHTGVKPYECRACSKRFFRRDHLLEHMSTHSKAAGRRLPWQCPVCGKGFQRQIAMRAHYQNEHVREGDWSGACRLCGFSAACQQSLHAHLAAQHGLQLGSVPAQPPAPTPTQPPAPTPLLLAHHFLAPLELRADTESPPGSPRPSQASPNSSQASPQSSSQVSPQSSEPGAVSGQLLAAVKTEPRDEQAVEEDEDDDEEEEAEEEPTGAAPLLIRRAPGLLPNNGGGGDRPDAAGGGGGGGSDSGSPSPGSSRLRSLLQDRRPASRASPAALLAGRRTHLCTLCGILFPDQTLYFMHKGCHAENNPWKCNICSEVCHNVYEFNSHLLSQPHQ